MARFHSFQYVHLLMPGVARFAVVQHGLGWKADPGEEALHEPVPLPQRAERIERAAAHQPEVAGIGRQADLADIAHQPVEGGGRLPLHPRLARADPAAREDHVHAPSARW